MPDLLDVQAAQYLPDDPAEPAWPPAIEIAVHAAGRYRLIGLTPSQARELARALARAADMLTALAPGTSDAQDEPAPARSCRLASRPRAGLSSSPPVSRPGKPGGGPGATRVVCPDRHAGGFHGRIPHAVEPPVHRPLDSPPQRIE